MPTTDLDKKSLGMLQAPLVGSTVVDPSFVPDALACIFKQSSEPAAPSKGGKGARPCLALRAHGGRIRIAAERS